jgi:alanine racemase
MSVNACIRLDLAAVRHNLATVRARVPGARVLAVIKADAYGHGLLRIAKTLDSVEGFAVARLDEALALRHAGMSQRIVVLQGFVEPPELELMSQHALEPVIHAGFQVGH